MLFQCDTSLGEKYSSKSQISRVISEQWIRENGYCLSCNSEQLIPTRANSMASDFFCGFCQQTYELKTFHRKPPRKLVDGAYAAMLSRIQSDSAPVLLLLERNDLWQVRNLTAIRNLFLTPQVIEVRKPLSSTARRAGWIGCSIRLDLIAQDARIAVVQEARETDHRETRDAFRRFGSLGSIEPNSRGWATLTLQVVRRIGQQEFSLSELYARESFFADVYPRNKNIRAKLRQQLQVLRDLGYVEFLGRGHYKLTL